MDDAGEQEVIDDDQAEMISSVVELADVTAGHIMTHRTDMTALEENMTLPGGRGDRPGQRMQPNARLPQKPWMRSWAFSM